MYLWLGQTFGLGEGISKILHIFQGSVNSPVTPPPLKNPQWLINLPAWHPSCCPLPWPPPLRSGPVTSYLAPWTARLLSFSTPALLHTAARSIFLSHGSDRICASLKSLQKFPSSPAFGMRSSLWLLKPVILRLWFTFYLLIFTISLNSNWSIGIKKRESLALSILSGHSAIPL